MIFTSSIKEYFVNKHPKIKIYCKQFYHGAHTRNLGEKISWDLPKFSGWTVSHRVLSFLLKICAWQLNNEGRKIFRNQNYRTERKGKWKEEKGKTLQRSDQRQCQLIKLFFGKWKLILTLGQYWKIRNTSGRIFSYFMRLFMLFQIEFIELINNLVDLKKYHEIWHPC